MTERQLVTGFELSVPICANVYGTAPCTAAIGVTGEYKCFNTPASCQDPLNYVEGDEKIIRWIDSSEYNNFSTLKVNTIPSLSGVRVSPMIIRPADDIGERESVTITFANHSDNDFYLDPYFHERDYNPYYFGDFWSKFDERYPNIQGYKCSVIRGYVGQEWNSMQKSRYIVDKGILSGDMKGYSITCRDVFMLLQNNKSQIPMPCDGFLSANIDDTLTPFTLEPTGIGSLVFPNGKRMYPDSGFAHIGEEYFQYTIVGDVVTPVARGLGNTAAVAHEEGESMQVVEVFTSLTSAQILERILTFTEIDTSWNDPVLWASEVEQYDTRLYSGTVSDPTQVSQVINDLIKDVCLTIFPDVNTGKIIFEYMRTRPAAYNFSDGNMFSITRGKNYDKRISAAYIRFGRLNPLKKMDENTNYLGRIYRLNDNMNEVLQKNSNVVFNQYSRFINLNSRDAADEITKIRLGRYSSPPRTLKFTLDQSEAPRVGKICSIDSRFLRDSRGFTGVEVPMQITSVAQDSGVYYLSAEEFKFNYEADPTMHIINVLVDQFNVNIRTLHDSIYSSVVAGDTVRLMIDPGVKIGANNNYYAVSTGSWPDDVILEIHFGSSESRIQGKGGTGAYYGGNTSLDGESGGVALRASYPVTVFGNGKIWGGGGGGAAQISPTTGTTNGGGGAGFIPGLPGATIDEGYGPFSHTAGGGDPGQPGDNWTGSTINYGGPAGYSIYGLSFVTIAGTPSILGPQI